MYFVLLTDALSKWTGFYSEENLLMRVFIYSFLVVTVYNYISYSYNNNFYVFSVADAVTYYQKGSEMASMPFTKSINFFLSFRGIDDLGMPLLSSMLYKICDSILFLNLFNIIFGIISSFCIYRISSHFMRNQYAFLCSFAYSISSFVLWFHSSGLKESFMCMIIVLFYDRFYLYLKEKHIAQLAYASILLISLLLFRPAIIFFCLGSIILSFILQKRKGMKSILAVIMIFILFISLYPFLTPIYDKILRGGNYSQIIEGQESEGMVKGSLQFTFLVNLLAQLIGPLPTISPDTRTLLSFYFPGLIYKVLLSIFFWYGIFYLFKKKADLLYPLAFFAIFEMASLLLILEGLELRKSLPHFFVIYIIAFWFMDQYQSPDNFKNEKIRWVIRSSFYLFSGVSFFLILVWNLRNSIS